MKACPNCQSTYEDWIEFCFNDGVPLVGYEPKAPARPSAARPPQAAPGSAFDAPEARMVSGADLPEPANLSRFSGAAPAAPTDAPERAPRAMGGVSPTALPEPRSHGAPAPAPEAVDASPVELAPPTPIAPPLPETDDETTSLNMAPPSAPAPVEEAPPVAAAPPIAAEPPAEVAAPAPLPPTGSTDLDADALGDIAAAMKAPSPVSTAVTIPFSPPVKESEDGKATIPMYTPYPAEPAGRSALDDEPVRKKGGGGGIGIALIGVVALAAFAIVAVVGIGWGVSQGGKEPVKAEQAKVTAPRALPAAAEPAPVPPPEAPPVEAPPVAAAPAPVAAAPTAATPTAATPTAVAKAPPATPTRAPVTTNGAAASTPKPVPTTAPPAARPVATTNAADGSSVTSDSVWGTPTAPTSGFLRIVTDPDGATVYVNDAAKGKTPATIELPYGAHQVRVVRAGYKTEVRDVNIRVRELTVPFNLKPEVVTGQVNVYGPDGFRVVVDGHDMGPMPVTVQVSEGVRQFKLVGSDGSACNLPKEIKFKTAGRPETITLACP